jgi:hypothetical protein
MAIQPVSAVSQGSAPAMQQFQMGDPNAANVGLGYAGLLNNRQKNANDLIDSAANREANIAQSKEQTELGRAEIASRESVSKSEIDAKKESDKLNIASRDRSDENTRKLQDDLFRVNAQNKILELKFAQANAAERERLAPMIVAQRKKASDLSGDIGTAKLLAGKRMSEIKTILEHAKQTQQQLQEMNKTSRDAAGRASDDALRNIHDQFIRRGKENAATLKGITQKSEGETGYIDDAGITHGYQFLKPSEAIVNSPLLGGVKDMFFGENPNLREIANTFGAGITSPDEDMQIDSDGITHEVNATLAKHVAAAISNATGGKIAPADLDTFIQQQLTPQRDAQGNEVAMSKLDIAQALSQFGVPSEVIKHTLLNISAQIDGTDPSKNTDGIMKLEAQRREALNANGGRETIQTKAMSATLQYFRGLATKSRMIAAAMPDNDIDAMARIVRKLDMALGNNQSIDRDDLLKEVSRMDKMGKRTGVYGGMSNDEDLIDEIMRSENLGDQEFNGVKMSPKDIEKLLAGHTGKIAEIESEKQRLQDLYDNPSSRSYADLIKEAESNMTKRAP